MFFYKSAKLECVLVKVGKLEVLRVAARPAAASQLSVITDGLPQTLPASPEMLLTPFLPKSAPEWSRKLFLHADMRHSRMSGLIDGEIETEIEIKVDNNQQ